MLTKDRWKRADKQNWNISYGKHVFSTMSTHGLYTYIFQIISSMFVKGTLIQHFNHWLPTIDYFDITGLPANDKPIYIYITTLHIIFFYIQSQHWFKMCKYCSLHVSILDINPLVSIGASSAVARPGNDRQRQSSRCPEYFGESDSSGHATRVLQRVAAAHAAGMQWEGGGRPGGAQGAQFLG